MTNTRLIIFNLSLNGSFQTKFHIRRAKYNGHKQIPMHRHTDTHHIVIRTEIGDDFDKRVHKHHFSIARQPNKRQIHYKTAEMNK